MPDNPYYHRNRIPHDSDMFFGRRVELDQLGGCLAAPNPQSVSVIGERRIGKSSLVWRAYHQSRDNPNVLAVWMDSHALDQCVEDLPAFYGFINSLVIKELARKGDRRFLKDGALFSDYAGFREFLEETANAGVSFCLVVEEFEKLAGKDFAKASFLGNLRHLCDHDEYRFVFVAISMWSLQETQTTEQLGSDFGNNFSQITVSLLEEKPLADLRACGFRQEGWALGEKELRQLHELAGAFPLFNQIVLSHLFEARKFEQSANGAFVRAKQELLPHYRTLWRKRSNMEQEALKKFAKGDDRAVKNMVELEGRGILFKSGETCRLFSKWFEVLIKDFFEFVPETSEEKASGYGAFMEKVTGAIGDTRKPIEEMCNLLKKGNETVSEGKKLGKNVIGLSKRDKEAGEDKE